MNNEGILKRGAIVLLREAYVSDLSNYIDWYEKIGFIEEGVEREVIYWKGRWRDKINYGLLREDWEYD